MAMSPRLTKSAMDVDDSEKPKINEIDNQVKNGNWTEIDKLDNIGEKRRWA
jgi:hypothetical protein